MENFFSLRPATEDDIAYVCEIERKVHVAPWSEESFRSELGKPYSKFLVMTDDETDSKIAGYIVYWIMLKDCQILNVVVDLPYRGLGLAKKMMNQALSASLRDGVHKIVLEVRKSNLAAVQLYQGLGFAISHVRKSFYSNGEDAYQMELNLEENGIRF